MKYFDSDQNGNKELSWYDKYYTNLPCPLSLLLAGLKTEKINHFLKHYMLLYFSNGIGILPLKRNRIVSTQCRGEIRQHPILTQGGNERQRLHEESKER